MFFSHLRPLTFHTFSHACMWSDRHVKKRLEAKDQLRKGVGAFAAETGRLKPRTSGRDLESVYTPLRWHAWLCSSSMQWTVDESGSTSRSLWSFPASLWGHSNTLKQRSWFEQQEVLRAALKLTDSLHTCSSAHYHLWLMFTDHIWNTQRDDKCVQQLHV